jgi:DNA-binding NarL/FixJ family response regulator
MPGGVVTVMLVDTQDLVRRGCLDALAAEPAIEVVAAEKDGAHAIASARRLDPHVVVMDSPLPDFPMPFDAHRLIRELAGHNRGVIVLTNVDHDELLWETLRAGARGFLLKEATSRQLVEAVTEVSEGNAIICPSMTGRLLDSLRIDRPESSANRDKALSALSHREVEVLGGIAKGRSNHQIAHDLNLADATVKSHVSKILTKMGFDNRVQAALFAYQMRI